MEYGIEIYFSWAEQRGLQFLSLGGEWGIRSFVNFYQIANLGALDLGFDLCRAAFLFTCEEFLKGLDSCINNIEALPHTKGSQIGMPTICGFAYCHAPAMIAITSLTLPKTAQKIYTLVYFHLVALSNNTLVAIKQANAMYGVFHKKAAESKVST